MCIADASLLRSLRALRSAMETDLYLMESLSLWFVEMIEDKLNVRSSYSQRGPIMAWIQTQILTGF